MFSLKEKVAIVTGGAGHLGSAMSEGLAQAGANVCIASRDEKKCKILASKLSSEFGVKAIGLRLDISSKTSIKSCFKSTYEEMGRIDILVNNAYFGEGGTMEEISEDAWNKGIDGTINGVFRCTQEVLPYMEENKAGSIINISSMYGIVSPDPKIYLNTEFGNPPNYGAGKAAIIQLTRYAACYLGEKGIRVNCVSPGPFPAFDVQKNKSFIEKLNNKVPLGRIGDKNELKGVIVFLASNASSYITGANISVDGGWTAW